VKQESPFVQYHKISSWPSNVTLEKVCTEYVKQLGKSWQEPGRNKVKLDNYQRRDACEICGKSKEMSPLVVLPIYTLLPETHRPVFLNGMSFSMVWFGVHLKGTSKDMVLISCLRHHRAFDGRFC
jgi:hypothetical protein